ncbi:MAG: glycosyl transferase family 2 [Bacteroidetes bacterium]|nr:glycosyl transferase family 2 [Bacteroidota bacterium]
MKLSIVIVNYNVKYFLEQCLLSVIKASRGTDTEILVVDNNSSDGSVDYIRSRFPSVTVIANKDNPGFSKANNQAIAIAKGEYVLILNPDTVVAEDTFDICIGFMESHAEAGALGVKMIDGKGNFLPESKRALPTPEVAFYKMFGLSAIFPKSRRFGKYHLSYLSDGDTNPVDILSGAFMFFRKKVLDEIGYFDEAFFMYGEDIDLSYRVLLAGYKNYYLADTTIIHYKGESTKKGSLNYVRVFYQAMIIFARKHFASAGAGLFSFLINMAVVFRALVTVALNLLSSSYLMLVDALLSFGAIYYVIHFWAGNIKNAQGYYPPIFIGVVVPAYILIWIVTSYFSSSYEKPYRITPIFRGVAVGTLVIAALYGFLPEEWRFSRAIILLGAICTGLVMLITRLAHNVLRHQQLSFEKVDNNRVIAVGSVSSLPRVRAILQVVSPSSELVSEINTVQTSTNTKNTIALFKAKEVIFCSDVLSYKDIIAQIVSLGHDYDYKILNDGADTLIGSNSKNQAGDLYAADINLHLSRPITRRQKRLFDLTVCIFMLPLLPVLIFMVGNIGGFLNAWIQVLVGKKTWVGYWTPDASSVKGLPVIKPGVIHHAIQFAADQPDSADVHKLNYLYARHYSVSDDLNVLIKNVSALGK